MWQANDPIPDLYRSALKSTLDMMNLCLDGVERLQDYHAGAAAIARTGQGEMAQRIGTLRSLPELQAAHAELVRSQMVRMMSYWSGICAASCQYQVELLNDAQAKALEVTDEIGQKLDAAPAAAVPVLSAMKMVVGAAQSTYAATARATEEFARLSAAQINAVSAPAVHQGNGKAKRAAA